MDQNNLVGAEGAESLNTDQDVIRQPDDNVNGNVLDKSLESTSSAPTTSPFSISSESNLLVSGKLYSDLLSLKQCILKLLNL